MFYNSKITLSKKSGPGEMVVGDVELELANNSVIFDKIQFTEPGEYVLIATPSNVDIEPIEIKISVIDPPIIEQESDEKEEEQPVENRPIIAQILQPTIKLDPMEFDASSSSQDNLDIGSSIGGTPFFWYNGDQIKPEEIFKLYLYHDGMLPKCVIVFRDSLGVLQSPETSPLTDTKFEIFLNSGSDVLKYIHLRFKLTSNIKNKNGSNTISGIIDIPNFYNKEYKSYDGASFEVIKQICSELGLGFNSNITQTIDSMKWRKKTVYKNFIEDMIEHSYISDDSFLQGYVDFYWSFNYIDVEKEWKRDISNDTELSTQGMESIDAGKVVISPLYLTNDLGMEHTASYFRDFKLNNSSTYKNMEGGVYSISKAYDRVNKQFLKFNIDSITSNGDDKIILKGAPGDTDELNKNYSTNYGGKLDTDNVHKDYYFAVEQNRRNLLNLSNISVDIKLSQPNFNLYKYQKIYLQFVNPKQTVSNEKLIDERLSGEWVIINISYTWIGGNMDQKLTLFRKEMGKTKDEIDNQVVQEENTVNNSEINENPIEIIKPNMMYEINNSYVIRQDNIEYILTVIDVLDDGISILGTIRKK